MEDLIDLSHLEKFDKDYLYTKTYFEMVNYIANYAQNAFQVLLPDSSLSFPIPINEILTRLGISINWKGISISLEKDDANARRNEFTLSSHFDLERKQVSVAKGYLAPGNHVLFKVLAYYLIEFDHKHGWFDAVNFGNLENPFLYSECVQMLASSLILPWRGAISYFLENEMLASNLTFDTDFIVWLSHLANDLNVCREEAMLAYTQFNRTIEAKSHLCPQDLDFSECKELERVLAKQIFAEKEQKNYL